MNEFDKIRNDGRLLYEYIRGSHLYDLNNEYSDIDTSGVFCCTTDELFGITGYKPQVSDSRHDNTWFEIGELMHLLLKSNPTVLEALFVPNDKVLGKTHPLMQTIIDNRNRFVSKQCFNPFYGYAKSQIEKARGLNKKITNPITERQTPYDFIYTTQGQGSTKFRNWLDNRGLHQEHCGLVSIPNMHDLYGVYYDFGSHAQAHENWRDDSLFLSFAQEYFHSANHDEAKNEIERTAPIGYRGVIDLDAKADELRLSSIEAKDSHPLCYIYYNQTGYSLHCRQYAEYQEWVKNRNPKRYESNLNKNYDSKNMMHCFRMIHMASEIAQGMGIILKRTEDRQFLLDVRNHKFEYDQIASMLEEDVARMNKLFEESTIQDKVDVEFVNELMIDIRKRQTGMRF